MSNNRLKFIGTNAPLPCVAAKSFIEEYRDCILGNTANYENVVVLLPTRGAARTLKESILEELFKSGVKNVLALNICTYEDYLAKFGDTQISKLESFSIWLSILLNCDFSLIDGLLPNPENISRKEVLYIAKEIIFLQQKLNDDLISIREASENFKDSLDAKRWQDLALLEDLYNYKAREFGKITALDNKFKSMQEASSFGVDRVVVIGNPDITKSLRCFVEEVESVGKDVEIFVFAEEGNREYFDDFGAAKELEYVNREISIREEDIYPCASPKEEAILLSRLVESYVNVATKSLGIACEQKESALIFQDAINAEKDIVISLENDKLSKTALFDLLKNIKAFLDEGSFEVFARLCLNSFVISYIESKGVGLESVLNQLDDIKAKTACKDIYALKNLSKNGVLKGLIEFFENIDISILEDKILELCNGIKDESEIEALEIFQSSLESIFSINDGFALSFNLDEVFIILFEALEGASSKTQKPKDCILLQDWMEIFWSKAPHILLCDMNDGIVPLRENNGLFLNDSMRKTLNMRTQKQRQARDAYMLDVLASSRAGDAYGISVLLSQRSISGESLVPSRILFQTKKGDIAKRVNLLFKEISPEISDVSSDLEWKLRVEEKSFEGNFSVSKLNTYLNSPWLFYLQNVLKMNVVDSDKEELDRMDFGNIYHSILEKFGKSELKNSENPEEINKFFLNALDDILYKDFANKPRIQIKIQLEDLKSRLYYTALEQVRHRKEGWEIICVEEKFTNYELAKGVLLNGVFDRIDYHEEKGYLIIDYKTKDKADKNIVENSHIKKKKEGIDWLNLQIPIYLEVFENLDLKKYKNADLNCAYFCATKDGASTKIYTWENAKDFVDEAKNIALEIAEKVKNKEFFDFESEDKYNNFGSLFRLDFDLLKKNVELI